MVRRDADSGVIDVDTNALADVTATQENASAEFRVFDGVADQVAQDGAEKHRVAVYCGGGLDGPNADSFAKGCNLMLVASLSKQGPDWNRRQLHSLRVLAEPDSGE
jgi:hypothetical protein